MGISSGLGEAEARTTLEASANSSVTRVDEVSRFVVNLMYKAEMVIWNDELRAVDQASLSNTGSKASRGPALTKNAIALELGYCKPG